MRNFDVLIKNDEILKKVKFLAKQINKRFKNEDLVLVCVLKGAVVFYSELLKEIRNKNIELDFIQIKSYAGTNSTGDVRLIKDISIDIENKNVVLVEDIIDTGLSANYLFSIFKNKKPKSILMCSLLQKLDKLQVELDVPLLVGFKIPNEFIIGFGLDLDEKYRNLKDILVFKRD